MWAPNNKVSIDSFVPLLTEKRFYLWRCKECNFEFHERFSIILNKYLSSETKDLKEMCPFCAELKERQDNISFEDLMNEWDYLNNLILGDPERIPNNTQLRFWWICKNNPEHRYRMAIVDKIANVKRSIEPCMFCKGRRRKKEHCILFPVSPYIARELCLMSKNLVDNMFLTFFIMLTISFWLGIWKLGDLAGNPK